MSLLGKYTENLIEDEQPIESVYTSSPLYTNDEDANLKKSMIASTVLHITTPSVIWIISLILALMGITFSIFDKPKPKMSDIEFVLVDKEDTPINKKTPYRADINSRAGGHHDPTRKVSMPSPAPGNPTKASQPAKPAPAKPTKQAPAVQKPTQNTAQTQSAPVKAEQAKPAPPTARPSIKPPTTPKPVAKPTSAFKVPVPSGGTGTGTYATGPISGSGSSAKGGASSGSTSSGSYTAGPSLAPTGGSSGSKLAKGGGGGTGGYGNPGPGNPNGRPGIDAIREPDFGPYMRDLQRRIKMNWDPPKGNESKRVVLMFKIAKDGRLLSCNVFKSSGLPNADKAAINAVQATAPFRPLPADFKGPSIDIQFTFDYNVFGASGYN